jgi:hypothetical protein
LRHAGIRFYFFSNEGNPREPLHVHASRSDADAKLWLRPDVRIAGSVGFSRREQTELVRVVEARRDDFMRAWYEHFGDSVRFDDVTMWVELNDGRTIGVPLAWFPRLLRATSEQRAQCRIGVTGGGLHWEDLDEDISVDGLLAGRGDMTVSRPVAA